MRASIVHYLLLASVVTFLKFEASFAQERSAEDRACILASVGKLPSTPGLRVDGSRVLPQPQGHGQRNPDLYNVIVEIDVKYSERVQVIALTASVTVMVN